MQRSSKKSNFIRVPRIITIIFILFISLFALDVFSLEGSLGEKLTGFLYHLLPSFFLLIILVISYKNALLSGILFIVLGLIFTLRFQTYRHLLTLLLISLIPLIIGVLFIYANYLQKKSI
jgi:hypothetical protein